MTRRAGRAMGSAPTPSGSPWAIGVRAMLAMVATLAVLVVEPPVLVLAVVAVGLANLDHHHQFCGDVLPGVVVDYFDYSFRGRLVTVNCSLAATF